MIRKSILAVAVVCCAAGSLSAQSFSVFGLDASAFPKMKAKFYAFDASGSQLSPPASELTLAENGIARQITTIDCPPHSSPPRISLAMSLDVSGSMGYSDFTEIPVELGKSTMTTLVPLIADPASEFALQTCNNQALIIQDFTTNRAKILSEISTLSAGGGNDFVEHLLNPQTGILNIAKTGKYKRVAVLYTDAWWDALPKDQLQHCIDTCTKYSIEFFAIIYSRPEAEPDGIKSSLRALAEATGGQMFDGIDSKQSARDVASAIDQAAQSVSPCSIEWLSRPECAPEGVTVVVDWKGMTTQASYQPPANEAAQLVCTPSSISLLPTQLNVASTATITVTAQHAPFSVTTISSTNPKFDINPKTFVLADGESKTLTVSYTPPDSDYSWTEFNFHTDLCDPSLGVSAGFPSFHSTARTLQLLKPNGGEVFVAGIDTQIVWKGITETTPVSLALSTDAGAGWTPIAAAATSGQYAWHVPKTPSNRCLVKVAQNGAGVSDGWVIRSGAGGQSTPGSMTADSSGNVYVVGNFHGTVDFGGTTLTANTPNYSDIFLAKYRPDGSLMWVKGIGAGSDDAGRSIVIDHAGNVCIAGVFAGTVDFGGITLNTSNGFCAFVAKYHPDGSIVWVTDATDIKSNGNVSASGVAVDASDNVYVTGQFTGTTDFGGARLSSVGQEDIFVAKYTTNGSLTWAKGAGSIERDWGNKIAVDDAGNCYLTGIFSWHCDFSGITLNADLSVTDALDLFVAKYAPDGSVAWAKRGGGPENDFGEDIALDQSGNAYVTGYMYGPSTFDGFTLNGKGFEMFVTKIAPNGVVNWLSSAGGSVTPVGIAVTPSGSSYVAGSYGSDMTLGGTKLKCYGAGDAFVAQFAADGTPEWAKRAGGSTFDYGYDICIGAAGTLYATGVFTGKADFDGDTLAEIGNNGNMYLWKMGTQGTVQADTSDAVFSIVMPQPASQDVDMGSVLVMQSRDSVVETFVRNTGTYPLRVDSMAIVGADASQFVIASGLPPFVVPAAGAQRVEFHFAPTTIGPKSATIRIFTQTDTLTQTITGQGIALTVAAAGNVIDFGPVQIGTLKDTTITVAIKNVGGSPIDFTSNAQLGPDMKQFSVQAGGAPFTLLPGTSQTVTLRFIPKYIGRASGRIGFAFNGVGSPAVLTVFGQGIGGLVRIPDDSGYAGDHRSVPVILEHVPVSSLQSVATNFAARVLYDPTILFPTSGTVAHGNQFDTLSIGGTIGVDSILGRIPFVAMLGKATTSPMSIVDFQWLDGSGNPADYDAETESGTFTLLGLCPAGGTRLFDPTGDVQIVHISPNPTSTRITVDINTIESGRTQLRVMNLLGESVSTLYDGELKPGNHSFQLNSGALAAGGYYLTLRTPTVQRLERIDIVK